MANHRTVHLIWHLEPHPSIRDHAVVVGVVLTGWQDAMAIVDAFNEKEKSKDYWKEEVKVLVP